MKLYVMTDLEGVAGVLDSENWCQHSSKHKDLAVELLTREVNAAVDGFIEGGATEIMIVDGHGSGGINPAILDPRVQLMRWYPAGLLPLDSSYDAVAWVGQHAKACTKYAHLAHTQSMWTIDFSVNGLSIGEFGRLALCAAERGVRCIFGSGDEAFTREAQALVPGIETVCVKWGTSPDTGEELPFAEYRRSKAPGIHLSVVKARELIREGACRAVKRAMNEDFGLIADLPKPPYRVDVKLRAGDDTPARTLYATHPSSIVGVLYTPLESAG
jgi:D-amino peptidase